MLLRPTLSAAVIALAAVVMLVPSAQAATPGSVQVSGKRLLSALPSASFFGSTYTIKDKYSSGNLGRRGPARVRVGRRGPARVVRDGAGRRGQKPQIGTVGGELD
jgi:hypothetical protein